MASNHKKYASKGLLFSVACQLHVSNNDEYSLFIFHMAGCFGTKASLELFYSGLSANNKKTTENEKVVNKHHTLVADWLGLAVTDSVHRK